MSSIHASSPRASGLHASILHAFSLHELLLSVVMALSVVGVAPAAALVGAPAASTLADSTVAAVRRDAESMAAVPADPPRTTGSQSKREFQDIADSFEELFHWGLVVRLLLGMALAVGCASILARHPRRATRVDPLSDLEEQKTLVVLGLVGAVVAELVTVQSADGANSMAQYLAFVIFGIGALMRFRTALDNPKSTGKAILVVVIGIACGLNEWALALYVTGAAFALLYWLDWYLACRVNVRLRHKQDIKAAYGAVQEVLQHQGCRVKSSTMYETKCRFVILAHMPVGIDPVALEAALQAVLPPPVDGDEVRVRVA